MRIRSEWRVFRIVLALLLPIAWGHEVFTRSPVAFDAPLAPNPPDNITLGAYYYPWWYKHFQVSNEGYLRRELYPRQEIRLGRYDDTQASVIQQHLAWSEQANIKVWVSSWWGPRSSTDSFLRHLAFTDKVELGDHKIAILYETTGRIKQDENGTYMYNKNVADDFAYICQQQQYFSHPNYYRINGRPVVAIYLTRLLDKHEVLDDVVGIIRSKCDHYDVYIIGDQVWGMPPTESLDHLDAVTNYDMYGNMKKPRYAGQDRVDAYFAKAKKWKEYAAEHNASFIPGCSPGYNDRGVRLDKNNTALSRRLDENQEEGTLLAAQLLQSIPLVDPGADYLLLVNSFNEWHEDTQVEPCDGPTTSEPYTYTQGLDYTGYGTLYLDILATYTLKEDSAPVSQLPVEFTGPVYADPTLGAYYYSWLTEENYMAGLRGNLIPSQTSVHADVDDTIIADLWMSWQANIKLWITPWTKPSPHATDVGALSIFDNDFLQQSDHRVALQYNVKNRYKGNDGSVDYETIDSDISYICEMYLDHPNYYMTSSGDPVLFLGLTRAFSDEDLDIVVNTIRKAALEPPCNTTLYLVGDQVWGDIEDAPYFPFSKLDAVMNHDVYGNMGEPEGYAGESLVHQYYEQQRQWRIAAWQEGCAYVPTVFPGFNDQATRASLGNSVLSRMITEDSDEGSFFSASLEAAKFLLPPELDNLMLVNSLNHFAEDTQIYPVCGATTTIPNSLTEGISYNGYGTYYLDILANLFGSVEEQSIPTYTKIRSDVCFSPSPTSYPTGSLMPTVTSAPSYTMAPSFGATSLPPSLPPSLSPSPSMAPTLTQAPSEESTWNATADVSMDDCLEQGNVSCSESPSPAPSKSLNFEETTSGKLHPTTSTSSPAPTPFLPDGYTYPTPVPSLAPTLALVGNNALYDTESPTVTSSHPTNQPTSTQGPTKPQFETGPLQLGVVADGVQKQGMPFLGWLTMAGTMLLLLLGVQ
eukprot:Nitzschia sp. Nitz4//scaffold27_size158506//100647//103643//NITZ4_002610-RA/size158506-snap-gene-0.202-mRNA-1//1//CDS//3329545518//2007//frame0